MGGGPNSRKKPLRNTWMAPNVEIKINNVIVILVVRDIVKINSTSTNTVPRKIMSEVVNTSSSQLLKQSWHCCLRRSAKPHHTSVSHKRMFAWFTINTMLHVLVTELTVTLQQKDNQMQTKLLSTFKTQRIPLDSVHNIHAIRVQQQCTWRLSQFAHPEKN